MKAPTARVWGPGLLAVAVAVAIAILGPCGGGEGAGGGGGGSTTAPPKSESLQAQAERVTASVFAGGDPEPSVGSAQGTVQTFQGPQPATAEVLSVEVVPGGLLLRWRLKSTGPRLDVSPAAFSATGPPLTSSTGVSLVDAAAQQQAEPSRFRQPYALSCTCSMAPLHIDPKGQVLTGLYPPLREDTKQVEVRIAGFPPITNVAVTRG